MAKSMLIDNSKCTGCKACQVACKQWNELPADDVEFVGSYESPQQFSGNTWTRVRFKEYSDDNKFNWIFTKMGCVHCTDAACEKVCPVQAISHTEFGTVIVDETKCIGCGTCASNCTFQVMSLDEEAKKAKKCTFCLDRLNHGETPACAKTCPSEAITFGDREEIINLAQERLEKLRNGTFPNADVYGIDELDGMGVIYILAEGRDNAEEKYGLPSDPQVSTSALIWHYALRPIKILPMAAVGISLLFSKFETKKAEEEG